ncbi:RAB7A-interacting MON1-CCZ1 complex subunit 1 isoform X1 [Emydura macquarii macquarii]|uniref:RAB7A-interacting MON1-CCZ1 complex subunit 1 isoform X1 n=1 Tax=Emydura macquarii macquarii TaxID=1129001 RepID=UPI003529F192
MAGALVAVAALRPRLAGLGRRLERLRRVGGDDAFLVKGALSLEKLKDLCKEDKENVNPANLLQLYTQIVLDITYFEENQLVDEDFPEDSSIQRVKELISILLEPEVLVKENNMHQDLLSVLGAELLECLAWRRGALLYMYCHTVKERGEWLTENIDLFKKCLNDGIYYLLKMLRFRCLTPLNDISFQDTDTARLLSEGIFSDTHVLAMMYSGEMCYWGLKHCGEEKLGSHEMDSESNTELYCSSDSAVLDFREVGEKMLMKYVAVCEGPLKGQDWNTTNAKLILDYFKKFHN